MQTFDHQTLGFLRDVLDYYIQENREMLRESSIDDDDQREYLEKEITIAQDILTDKIIPAVNQLPTTV